MSEYMSHAEQKITDNVSIQEIDPLGYGNPESKISYHKQIESGELSPETDQTALEAIGRSFRSVTEGDDGCIDGRPAVEKLCAVGGELVTLPVDHPEEHVRAKVAGGGYITGTAMELGLGRQAPSLDATLAAVAGQLAERGIFCGAHTGEHSHGDGTDCGANDKMQIILENGILFRDKICVNLRVLVAEAGIDVDETALAEVFEGWSHTLGDESFFAGSTGASRFNAIEGQIAEAVDKSGRPLAVSKHLAGDHNEDYIVINYREDETLSQVEFKRSLAAQFPDIPESHLPQVFVVDVARIVQLARALTTGNPDEFHRALYAGLAYQLATAATLTDGSLRTFIVK